MKFPRPLVPGVLIRRYKRFLADVTLPDGSVALAHCPNPGAMTSVAIPGGPVHLLPADPVELAAGRRKLAWTWALARCGETDVLVDTSQANGVVAEAIAAGAIPALAGYAGMRAEVRYGEKSRVDLLLESPGRRCYVEVKNVTLRLDDGAAAFPDAVTERGARHLAELARVIGPDTRAALVHLVRADATEVRPAAHIDPAYAAGLRAAVAAGVEVYAVRALASPDGVVAAGLVPVTL